MNIFMLSYETNPHRHYVEQAKFHCDKHVIKMIAETTQLIVTSLSVKTPDNLSRYVPADLQDSFPCKPLSSGHAKHPCAIWAREDISHVNYLCNLGIALCMEKERRYPIKPWHEYAPWLRGLRHELDLIGLSTSDAIPAEFPVAIKDARNLQTRTNHVHAVNLYRDYYIHEKASFATWRNPAVTPVWFLIGIEASPLQATSVL